jgi:RecB family exonuclease
MPITRKFIDPSVHVLRAAAAYLLDRAAADRSADLGSVVVVVPGGRAGRRLLELLVELADERQLDLIPPEVRTVGNVPELFYRHQRPFANELTQQLAWARVLADADRSALGQILGNLPADQDHAAWRELGELLRRTHLELAADGLNFDHVIRATADAGEQIESGRWKILKQLQQDYLELVDSFGLWDRQTARLVAIRDRECTTDRQIVLVATVDINRSLRHMLDQIADHVTALVPAPRAWADRFDEHGCLLPATWQDVEIDLPDRQLIFADDPADQADAVVRCIAGFGNKYRADEITVGVPDESTLPQIQQLLRQCGLPARWGPGWSAAETTPYRLLEAIGRYVGEGRYEDFAALVRHPDVFDWLGQQGVTADWLTQLDEYFGTHLPARLGRTWLGKKADHAHIKHVYELVEKLVGELREAARPLGDWTDPLSTILTDIYGSRELDRQSPSDRAVLIAWEHIHAALAEQQVELPRQLMPEVSAPEALRITLERARTGAVPALPDKDAIELLGWLELPLDDAPAMIVTSFNEGFVPKAVNADLMLPDALRRRLGLEDNARRYARDAYALSVMLAARSDVTLIVARRNGNNDPLAPSRLLFAADQQTTARRALRLFGEPPAPEPKPPLSAELVATRDTPDIRYMMPKPLREPITSLSPTGFRSYLACPYRFYLQHVLRLEAISDDARELDGATFGTLLHEVLRQFGAGEHRDSTDAQEIRRELTGLLDQLARKTFADEALAAVSVQLEQARLRLAAFAEHQALRAHDWQIEHTELYLSAEQAELVVDGQPFYLRGRIDRVDVHRQTGERVVLDYKSSDTPTTPERAHLRSGEWVDLQLPLYRHLVQAVGIAGPVQLGYVQLPRDVTKIEFRLAEWSEEDLQQADAVAADVVRNLRNGVFWPPTDPPPQYAEDYAWLCHDGVFDKPRF